MRTPTKNRIRILTFILVISLFLLAGGYVIYILKDIPSIYALKHLENKPVSVIYGLNNEVAYLIVPDNRIYVEYTKIPKYVRDAFLAAEDADFFKHKGIEPESIIRAIIKNLIHGKLVQGGSTITQQVIKTLILGPEKSISRKIREAVLAYKLERYLTKKEILNLYLNNVYLGHGVYGVEAASQVYFGKHVWELSRGEAALLAGIVQAPARYSPKRHPGLARLRQEYVIQQMWEKGMITEKQKKEMLKEKISVREDHGVFSDSYFKDYVVRYIEEKYGKGIFSRKSLKIYTTVDTKLQRMAEEVLRDGLFAYEQRRGRVEVLQHIEKKNWEDFLRISHMDLKISGLKPKKVYTVLIKEKLNDGYLVLLGNEKGFLKTDSFLFKPGDITKAVYLGMDTKKVHQFVPKKSTNVQGALICMNPNTGYVYAVVGGADFEKSPYNRALYAKIQCGSAFKPFVYLAALKRGYDLDTLIPDEPREYPSGFGKVWVPKNYDGRYDGMVSLRDALAYSKNAATVGLLQEVGLDSLKETLSEIGLNEDIPHNLSVALGTSNLTLMELVKGYAVFANGGYRVKPLFVIRVEDQEGNVLEQNGLEKERVLEEDIAYKMNLLLSAVVEYGTAKAASSLGWRLAGKTGTTSNYFDALFIGYSENLISGVWVGFDQRTTLGEGESGARVCLPIWMRFMAYALKRYSPSEPVPTVHTFGGGDEKGIFTHF
ncbi:MAG: PBP1A family penicillin-binding protein [Deltaproteobacteria bacterium]|nr:PBP1A family penicillin-binding protein [Deltaproteobacteria bacterium]